MSHNDRKTSGRDQPGTAAHSGTHGPSPMGRRDEKDPNYDMRTPPKKDEMPELASWDTQAAGVVTRVNHHTGQADREGEQDEDYEDPANEMQNEGGNH
jgi:hypothetical protein